MMIGASSFAGSIPELIEEVESIELYVPKLGVYEGTRLIRTRIKKIRDILSGYEITTSIHAPYYSTAANYPHDLVVDTSKLNRISCGLLTDCIKIANYLGSGPVVIHPGRIGASRQGSFDNMVEILSSLARVAEDNGVLLGLENKEGTDPGNLCCSVEELIGAVLQVDSPNLGVTLDIGHANLTCGGDPVRLREFVRMLKDFIVHVHVHDNSGQLTERYFGDFHGAPGTGVVDFTILNELDFDGVFNLEVFSMEDVREGKKILRELNNS